MDRVGVGVSGRRCARSIGIVARGCMSPLGLGDKKE